MNETNITMVRGDTVSFLLEYEGTDQMLDSGYLVIGGNSGFTVEKTINYGITYVDEGQYIVQIDPEDTAELEPGVYKYGFQIGINGDVFTLLQGSLIIEEDYGRSLATIPPVIIRQPRIVAAATGHEAEFIVLAKRAQEYKWQYSEDYGDTWETASNDQVLKIGSAGPADAARLYRCIISNPAGNVVTATVMLMLSDAAPVVMKQPEDVYSVVGANVTFSTIVNCADSYQWQASTNGGTTWYNTSATGNQTDTLRVTVNETTAGLLFRCAATNTFGTVYSNNVRIITT